MKKLLSLVLSFALVCTLISGCGPKGGGGNSSNQPLDAAETTFGLTPLPERTTLTIGFFSGSAHSMPWYIADRMGFFDELNIDVEYESFIGGPAMMEASASWDICDVGAPGILNGMKNYDIQMLGLCDNEYNTGIKQSSPVLINVAKTCGASNFTVFRKIGIPSAMTMTFAGIRVALGNAWATLVAAEMLAANAGLGYMILQGRQFARADIIILGIVVIGVIGVIFTSVLGLLEKKVLRWKR